jgi:hypothetical protein
MNTLTRRDFGAAMIAAVPALAQAPPDSQLGTLYQPIQDMAAASPLESSFLRPEFRRLADWQIVARAKLFDLPQYRAAAISRSTRVLKPPLTSAG